VCVLWASAVDPWQVRRAGTDLDVKRSTYRKLLVFLEAMAEEGLLKLRVEKGVSTVLAIDGSHPQLRAYRPYPAGETTEAAESSR
jgi:translation initiation factor 2D